MFFAKSESCDVFISIPCPCISPKWWVFKVVTSFRFILSGCHEEMFRLKKHLWSLVQYFVLLSLFFISVMFKKWILIIKRWIQVTNRSKFPISVCLLTLLNLFDLFSYWSKYKYLNLCFKKTLVKWSGSIHISLMMIKKS